MISLIHLIISPWGFSVVKQVYGFTLVCHQWSICRPMLCVTASLYIAVLYRLRDWGLVLASLFCHIVLVTVHLIPAAFGLGLETGSDCKSLSVDESRKTTRSVTPTNTLISPNPGLKVCPCTLQVDPIMEHSQVANKLISETRWRISWFTR